MTTTKPAIRKGRKFDQVLAGARTIFLRDGFDGASVDDIAREAKVSKATLYSYFPDKRLLFKEVATNECRRQAIEAAELIDRNATPEAVLTAAAYKLVAFMTSTFGISVHRICIAESSRFPELGCAFYESGPQLVREILTGYLREAVERNELFIDDIEFAAEQFAQLCHTRLHDRLMFGVEKQFSQAEIDRTVNGAVEMFLARYGVKG